MSNSNSNRISTEDLRRIVAQQDLADFRCPQCGHDKVRVTADYSLSIDMVAGIAVATHNHGRGNAATDTIFFACDNRPACNWTSDGYQIEGDGNSFIPESAGEVLDAAVKAAWKPESTQS